MPKADATVRTGYSRFAINPDKILNSFKIDFWKLEFI